MKASVVMATYNGARYLRAQVDSILQGMGVEDELIIADDGSTDQTSDILEQYCAADNRVILLPDKSHKGVVGNFNYAIEHSSGDIIILADQDDIWFSSKISTLKEYFKRDPKLTCILSDLTIIDSENNEIENSFFSLRKVKSGFFHNFLKNSYIGNAMAFRCNVKPYILPIPERVPMHDQWIGLINEKYGKVLFLEEPLGAYRRHSQNVTSMKHGPLMSMLAKRWNLACELCRRSKSLESAKWQWGRKKAGR